MSNGAVAPVCPVSRNQPLPGMPAPPQAVPLAVDLPSALLAAAALTRAVMPMAGLSPQPLQNPVGASGSANVSVRSVLGLLNKPHWSERRRSTCKIKYYQMDDQGNVDKDIWVEVERITHIEWRDSGQGISLVFDWPYDPTDPYEGNSEFISGTANFYQQAA